jgi:predicted O-linked N-acetylglucosamine transferase (SPINDLY family)
MGAAFYDYILTDRMVTPASDAQYYMEKFLYLPNSYLITDNTQTIADKKPTRKAVGLPEKAIVLASFNHNFKLEKECFEIWLDVLAKHDNTVLWLYETNEHIKAKLLDYAKNYNQTDQRIIFAGHLPKPEHLARMQLADLVLDTFTCNGHTTTVDALWAGVPVIALYGEHFTSRVSSSVLDSMDLAELITKSKSAYKDLISQYCQNPEKIKTIKQKIERNRKKMPLFDTKLYTKNLEKALKSIS